MDLVLKFLLGFANVPDQDVSDLEKDKPELARLLAASKQLRTIFAKNQPLQAHIEQADPIVRQAWPDFLVVLPTAEEFVALAVSRQT